MSGRRTEAIVDLSVRYVLNEANPIINGSVELVNRIEPNWSSSIQFGPNYSQIPNQTDLFGSSVWFGFLHP